MARVIFVHVRMLTAPVSGTCSPRQRCFVGAPTLFCLFVVVFCLEVLRLMNYSKATCSPSQSTGRSTPALMQAIAAHSNSLPGTFKRCPNQFLSRSFCPASIGDNAVADIANVSATRRTHKNNTQKTPDFACASERTTVVLACHHTHRSRCGT